MKKVLYNGLLFISVAEVKAEINGCFGDFCLGTFESKSPVPGSDKLVTPKPSSTNGDKSSVKDSEKENKENSGESSEDENKGGENDGFKDVEDGDSNQLDDPENKGEKKDSRFYDHTLPDGPKEEVPGFDGEKEI